MDEMMFEMEMGNDQKDLNIDDHVNGNNINNADNSDVPIRTIYIISADPPVSASIETVR